MRTTVRLNDALLDEAREEARRRGETLTSLIEKALYRELRASRTTGPRKKVVLPFSDASGGLMPGVDINNSASLLDIMEEGLPLHKLR
jgi:hypothetical protein